MDIETKPIPVLIRHDDPRFHTTALCAMIAGARKEESIIRDRLCGVLVTTLKRAQGIHKKTRCKSSACLGVPCYDSYESRYYGEPK